MGLHPLARPRVRRAALIALAMVFAAYLSLLVTGRHETVSTVLYDVLLLSGAAVCAARVIAHRENRLAWGLLAVGLTSSASADIVWWLVYDNGDTAPYPSLSDVLWLGFYPCCYATMLLLLRSRRRSLPAGMWLDGAIAALGSAALVAALVLEPVLAGAVDGAAAATVTNLAYPLGDLVLVSIVLWAFGSTGWRPGRQWLVLGFGMVVVGAADTTYLVMLAHGTYDEGNLIDALWPLSALLMGWAAWQPATRGRVRFGRVWLVLVPAGFALSAIGLLAYDHVHRMSGLSIVLAVGTLLLAVARMGVTFLANLRMLEASRRDAVTDALTGLGNRRALMEDLDAAMEGESVLLALFDLDGFKRYNDTFGHPAGDALLKRLGSRLGESAGDAARAYRMGGDEFCLLAYGREEEQLAVVEAASEALRESGEGFSIAASHGTVRPSRDVASAAEALQVADQRMYGHKLERAAGRSNDARDVLMRILHEREPDLHDHTTSVAELARTVGRSMGLTSEALDELARAAELHDIGKMAIPDSILSKPGPLNDDEWAFMRRHTLIGEAILSASPALVPVARIVRSSHERWDGRGYPDRLAGEDIPIAARIVAICDAYDAMTSDRSYRRGMALEKAVAELLRSAGTQFDPRIVTAFCDAVSGERASARAAAATSNG